MRERWTLSYGNRALLISMLFFPCRWRLTSKWAIVPPMLDHLLKRRLSRWWSRYASALKRIQVWRGRIISRSLTLVPQFTQAGHALILPPINGANRLRGVLLPTRGASSGWHGRSVPGWAAYPLFPLRLVQPFIGFLAHYDHPVASLRRSVCVSTTPDNQARKSAAIRYCDDPTQKTRYPIAAARPVVLASSRALAPERLHG